MPSTNRKRSGQRHGQSNSREQILRIARELFAEVGYDRTTIRKVATLAEVDPVSVLYFQK